MSIHGTWAFRDGGPQARCSRSSGEGFASLSPVDWARGMSGEAVSSGASRPPGHVRSAGVIALQARSPEPTTLRLLLLVDNPCQRLVSRLQDDQLSFFLGIFFHGQWCLSCQPWESPSGK